MHQIRGEPIRAAALLSLLLFSIVLSWVMWSVYVQPPLPSSRFFFAMIIFIFWNSDFLWNTKAQVLKRSDPWFCCFFCLSEQVRVCCSSTNRPSSPLIYLSCRFISSSRRPDWRAKDWATRVMSQRKERRATASLQPLLQPSNTVLPPVCATRADASRLCVW